MKNAIILIGLIIAIAIGSFFSGVLLTERKWKLKTANAPRITTKDTTLRIGPSQPAQTTHVVGAIRIPKGMRLISQEELNSLKQDILKGISIAAAYDSLWNLYTKQYDENFNLSLPFEHAYLDTLKSQPDSSGLSRVTVRTSSYIQAIPVDKSFERIFQVLGIDYFDVKETSYGLVPVPEGIGWGTRLGYMGIGAAVIVAVLWLSAQI